MEVDVDPSHIVLDGDPAPPPKWAHTHIFGPSIVAKRSPISATAEHLFVMLAASLLHCCSILIFFCTVPGYYGKLVPRCMLLYIGECDVKIKSLHV